MCGIIGVLAKRLEAAPYVLAGLQAQQHRGQEGVGITTSRNTHIFSARGMGEVQLAFRDLDLSTVPGTIAIGHDRYSTIGDSNLENTQPILGSFRGKEFAVVHNGSLVNIDELALKTGIHLTQVSDTHLIADLVSQSKASSFEDALIETANQLKGAFNLIFLFNDRLYVLRDRFGFHPLQIAQLERGDWIVASESCVFDALGADFKGDIDPGTLLVIEKDAYWTEQWAVPELKVDSFEFIYFSAPPSVIHGAEAGIARYWMGIHLAKRFVGEQRVEPGAIIVPIPDSGNEAALGFYEALLEGGYAVKYRAGALFRSHASNARGRTFIEPSQDRRQAKLALKFNPRPAQLHNANVIAIDDSIVRGNTMPFVVKLLRKAGARSVRTAIASPPILYSCFYGTDTSRDPDLIAAKHNGNIPAIARAIGLDSLTYLDIDSVRRSILTSLEQTTAARLTPISWPSKVHLSYNSFYEGQFTGIYPDGIIGDFSIPHTETSLVSLSL